MSGISTHVLDASRGRPAAGIAVALDFRSSTGKWELLGKAETDAGGRVPQLLPEGAPLVEGVYRLRFEPASEFYPEVSVVFRVSDPAQHYHIPLIFSPYGYSTYRGS